MGVDVTQDDGVGVVDEVEESSEVRHVARRTRRGWRNVDVEDHCFAVVDVAGNTLDLRHAVVEACAIDGGEREGVMDEKRHSPPPPPTRGLFTRA